LPDLGPAAWPLNKPPSRFQRFLPAGSSCLLPSLAAPMGLAGTEPLPPSEPLFMASRELLPPVPPCSPVGRLVAPDR